MRRGALAVAACAVLFLVTAWTAPAQASARAAYEVSVHGWFSGQSEVWSGMYAVDFTLNYRASVPVIDSGYGFVWVETVQLDIVDPMGNPSSGVTASYHRFSEVRPTPIRPYGLLEPYDSVHSIPISIRANAGAMAGTWQIRPRMLDWYMQRNGMSLDRREYATTIDATEDWYPFTVHPQPAANPPPATSSSGSAGSGSGGGGASRPAATLSIQPAASSTSSATGTPSATASPGEPPEAIAQTLPAQAGPRWWIALVAGLMAAVLAAGATVAVLTLARQRRRDG